MIFSLAIEIAKQAGIFLKANIGNITTIEQKSSEINLVTDIDKRSEAMIIGAIKKQFPTHDIVAEESGRSAGTSDYRWIIDPLDGTTNYMHGLPMFCVSIGIEHKGEIIAGVIYDPMHDELFTAEKGSGAFLNGKRIQVSAEDRLIRSLLITGFPYDVKNNPFNAIEHFNNFVIEAQAIRRLGSAAIDLAYVACGRAEGFWEVQLHPWDIAAGVIIIREAGGTVTNFEGKPMNAYTPNIVASNGKIHDEILRVLSKC
ncbi:MAG: inositol monophosphatase family protein [Bacteroidota bacterium]